MRNLKKVLGYSLFETKTARMAQKSLKNTITHFSSVNIYLCRPVFLRCKCVNTFLAG